MHYFDLLIALIGIGFLIFIHELGHYWMAKVLGMKVETFSIGFGTPLISWNFQNVQWQIGWIPLGGYVKIQGMDLSDEKNPYDTPGSFYNHSPWDRIKVSFMGPMANFLLALLFFFSIWVTGGRNQDFAMLSRTIGWVDPQSDLYAQGVRPGDELIAYDKEAFKNFTDHLKAPLLSPDALTVTIHKSGDPEGLTHDYLLKPYPLKRNPALKSIGIVEPARYLMMSSSSDHSPFLESSALQGAGAMNGDRLVWIDGETLYSKSQLEHILNDSRLLLTIQRGKERLLRRVPLVSVEELKLSAAVKAEISDWQYEAHLQKEVLGKLCAIPYDLNAECVVEGQLPLIDAEEQQKAFPLQTYSSIEEPLEVGDKIISVAGHLVHYTHELFAYLQHKQVLMMVERANGLKASGVKLDIPATDIQLLTAGLLNGETVVDFKVDSGSVHLLKPITPKPLKELYRERAEWNEYENQLATQKQEIEQLTDVDLKHRKLKELEEQENHLMLGVALVDKKITYNPNPLRLFQDAFNEVSSTLVALLSGALGPDNLSGPIGIVQTIQMGAAESINQLFFWLGFISINLGFLNLLPIPVLDGGYILMFLYEMISRKRLNPKIVEKLMIPFVVLLIGFLLYASLNDILRMLAW